MRGATASATSMAIGPSNFNPRSSCEERRKRARRLRGGLGFQSTLLMRGATSSSERGGEARVRDFNPRSSCEERPAFSRTAAGGKNISIHAPHARSDFRFSSVSTQLRDFNPRSSCEERRAYLSIGLSGLQTFQSTLLMRGATRPVTMASFAVVVFQSTLLMRGATDFDRASSSYVVFQSTLLMRGATSAATSFARSREISIHAPHARSDAMARRSTGDSSNFNPRSSCEERPVREHRMLRLREISIHAPHARSDRRVDDGVRRITYFNPRSSCEERLQKFKRHCVRTIFQSTLLMRGATAEHQGMLSVHAISIHAPHARSDRGCDLMDLQELQFQSTLLMRGATR